jgi:hypothetical protein
MLAFDLLKNCGGITLISDYLSLRRLHDVIHDINERSSIIRDREGFLIGLAYDVRKAYEKKREIIKAPEGYPEHGERFGERILWPTILVQCRMMREGLAFMDHGKEHQAVVYELEHILEVAIDTQFKGGATAVKAQWRRLDPAGPYLEENVETRVAQFAGWSKTERRRGLAGLLSSLDPLYERMYPYWVKSGVPYLVSPADYALWNDREFPDPKC